MEKLEWRVDLTQVSQSPQILVNAPSKISATHDTRRYPRVIRSSFQRIVSYYLFFGSLAGTSKCSSHKITVYLADKIKIHKQAMSKRDRERESCGWQKSWTYSAFFAKVSRIYTGARLNNSRSNVYRGDFRKRKKALRAIHARQSAYCGDLWKHAKATCRLIHVLIRMFRRLPYTESTGFYIWHPAGCHIWASSNEVPATFAAPLISVW